MDEENNDFSALEGLLDGKPATETTTTAKANEPAAPRNSTAPNPGTDDDAPDERRASGEDTDSDEPGESAAIEAPASWDGEAKEKFKALSPELQKFISEREADREKGVNAKLQESARAREAFEAKHAETAQYRDAYEQRLISFARQLESTIPDEFKAIKSPADAYAVSQKDPALYARYMAFKEQVVGLQNEFAQINAQRQNEIATSHREHLAKEHEAISKVWPEFVDQAKGPAIRAELSSYAKERGFNDQEVSGLADHRLVMVLRDAIEGRKAKAALEKAKGKIDAKPLPKVSRPGQGEGRSGNGLDKSSINAALRSGNEARTVDALQSILEGRT